jgi:hypothetical protein
MPDRYVRVVSLWIHPGQEAAFEAFEREAARLMARHGGRIDHAVRLTPPPAAPSAEDIPYELHIVSFPDEASFEAYSSDPATLALREKRPKIIARTVLLAGREAGPY